MNHPMPRPLRLDRSGSTLVEFAIIGSLLMVLTFTIVEIGLILCAWGGMQAAATLAARCGAIAATSCTSTAATQTYAMNQASIYLFGSAINTSNVAVLSGQSTCGGLSGKFYYVQITCPAFGNNFIAGQFQNIRLSVSSCYPMA